LESAFRLDWFFQLTLSAQFYFPFEILSHYPDNMADSKPDIKVLVTSIVNLPAAEASFTHTVPI